MDTIIGLLTSRASLLVIALGLAWMWHVSEIDNAITEHDLVAREERRVAVDKSEKQAAIDKQKLKEKFDKEKAEIQAKYDDLLKTVQSSVSKAADAKCIVPAGFVWHYDATWGMPGLAKRPGNVDLPSGVPLSFVLSTDVQNAKACADKQIDLNTWKEWSHTNRERFKAFKERTQGKLP